MPGLPIYVLAYWREIESGSEIVSMRIRQLHEKLAEDIEHPQKPYAFDAERVLRPIEYIEGIYLNCNDENQPFPPIQKGRQPRIEIDVPLWKMLILLIHPGVGAF